jgi:hypothetical protein
VALRRPPRFLYNQSFKSINVLVLRIGLIRSHNCPRERGSTPVGAHHGEQVPIMDLIVARRDHQWAEFTREGKRGPWPSLDAAAPFLNSTIPNLIMLCLRSALFTLLMGCHLT